MDHLCWGGGIILNNSMYFHEIIVKCKCQLERFEHLPKNKLTLIHIVCSVYENNYSMYVIIVPIWNVLFLDLIYDVLDRQVSDVNH